VKDGDSLLFECNELPLSTDFCIFHDPNYYQKFPENIGKRLERKLKMLGDDITLDFIGYLFINFNVTGEFVKPVYFSKAIFH
jgi:hypothetical protein